MCLSHYDLVFNKIPLREEQDGQSGHGDVSKIMRKKRILVSGLGVHEDEES